MKVLVAPAQTQGARRGDFHHAVEGELVRIDPPCAADRRDPDGRCGCGRAFAGLNSARATTTARVADLPLSRADVVEALRSSLAQQGWDPAEAAQEADDLLRTVADVPVGTVYGRRLSKLVALRTTEETASG
ncbi:DUF7715 family protein [Actinomycetospora cinnamomea]|uniref:DUF7715 domain-containing protein n=1 Tax=Actinomycetospora cinnamomea TaxID=663609 RepID=A0A2U1EVB5_9PSEU|nr:hypothetical protein [Actinomycetospora cinnamomea]PVZ03650.1 hypothetical protein C8D89_1206 [Actinomycetospora cinnamomea]